ncbi:trimeric dUTP diphosphatase [Bacillus phage Eldridge]|uniref:dUTP diphosphatase n=1 Tax=Bacillus phage Eldridge TaxID=1776293 RepID=A0A109QIU1_9CAUD|nr:trimeric dUTP diphosphatase [Bacillus phage Eldridge]AMB18684.1 trimeric dUTP diphosphatase [Bacillus phage Eldridge]
MKEIEVLYLEDKDLIAPTQGYDGDYGTDIYTSAGALVPHSTFKSIVIPTNLFTAFDPFEAGMIAALRSGVGANSPVIMSNAIGIIEGTYRGNIGVILRNTFADNSLVDFVFDVKGNKIPLSQVPSPVKKDARDFFETESAMLGYNNVNEGNAKQLFKKVVPRGTVYIPKGTRIAQIFFADKINPIFKPVKELPDSSRGENGYGSSGLNKK